MKRLQQQASGFTLIELLVTIAVMTILLMIAVPNFQEFVRGQRVKTTSFDMFAALTYARSEALKRNGDVTIAAVSGDWNQGWTVTSGSTTLRSQASLSSSVSVTAGQSSVTFGRDGRATGLTWMLVNANPSAASIPARCIRVDLSGRPNSKKGTC